jgi:coenzyme Q-binding protein COQ10
LRRHTLKKVLPYAPDQLFRLVGDIEHYPDFVPWLTTMRTWNAHEIEPGVNVVDAEAGVGFSFLRETFATRVIRDANERHIGVNLIRGPFKALKNDWRFREVEGGPESEGLKTEIDFCIEFEFKSRLLDAFLAANMDRAIEKLIACFEGRARALYGAQTATQI